MSDIQGVLTHRAQAHVYCVFACVCACVKTCSVCIKGLIRGLPKWDIKVIWAPSELVSLPGPDERDARDTLDLLKH